MTDATVEDGWSSEGIKVRIKNVIDALAARDQQDDVQVNTGDVTGYWSSLVHKYLRWSLAAGKPGPPVAEMMAILGRDTCLKRLQTAEDWANLPAEQQ